jgi:AcrR family transcriptional regulator
LEKCKRISPEVRIPSTRYESSCSRPTSRYDSKQGTDSIMAVLRDLLLHSALQVVTRDGFGAMTLDAVAKAAGVSKGGLIHYFPNKDALITGMLDFYGEHLQGEIERRVAVDPLVSCRHVRAMLQVAFPWLEPTGLDMNAGQSDVIRMFLAMITAAGVNRELLAPLRDRARTMMTRMLSMDADAEWQLITWMAVDGLILWQFLGLLPPSDPLQEQLIRRLYAMTKSPPQLLEAAS